MNGWAGTILRVDLSTQKIDKEPLNMKWAHAFIGGRGLNSRTLYSEVGPGTDPMGPNNKLIVGVGPCNGTLVPGSSSLTITTKSPLSGLLGDSSTRAIFGAVMKYAGYDQIIIQGKSETPVYLWIEDDQIEIREATHLWGKNVRETIRILEKENKDPGIGVLCIGPAGENLVKFAAVMGQSGRAAGRTGVGTVMGSKKLKAIVATGNKGVKVANPQMLEEAYLESRKLRMDERKAAKGYELKKKYGPVQVSWDKQDQGILPTRNYQAGMFDKIDGLDPESISRDYYGKSKNCFGCFLPCDRIWVVTGGPYAGAYGAALEAGHFQDTASRVGISNPNIFLYIDAMLDEYGLDMKDWSGVTGLAIECYLKGIINSRDMEGLELDWGAEEAIVKLLDMIVYRRGLGDALAEGVRGAAKIIGRGADQYALHVKGLTPDSRDPRGAKGWGLGYATSSRGAEHCRTSAPDSSKAGIDRFSEDDKPAIVKWCQDCLCISHCLEACYFCWPSYDFRVPDMLAKIYTAVTGVEATGEQLMRVGERLTNLERCFNIREGLQKSDDGLPDRFTKEALPEGASKGQVVNIGPMIDKYYELRGWDVGSGLPKRANLEPLGLKEMADELASLGRLAG